MAIQGSILQDFQRLIDHFESSISDFQSALDTRAEKSDLKLMLLKHSKMGVDGLVVDAVMDAMLHQN